MLSTIGLMGSVVVVSLMSLPVAALDFDREIAKQQRSVKVKYKKAPKSLAHFMHQYAECKSRYGSARALCNNQEARRRYNAYRDAWEERQRRQVAMSTGEFQISLEKKAKDDTSGFQE